MTHRVQNCYQTRHFATSASSVGTSAVSQTAHLQSAAVYLLPSRIMSARVTKVYQKPLEETPMSSQFGAPATRRSLIF